MVAFMHTGTRLTAGYRYTTLGDATNEKLGRLGSPPNFATAPKRFSTRNEATGYVHQ